MVLLAVLAGCGGGEEEMGEPPSPAGRSAARTGYAPRRPEDTSGFTLVAEKIDKWPADASLEGIADLWKDYGTVTAAKIDRLLASGSPEPSERASMTMTKATLLNYQGDPQKAYQALKQVRAEVERRPALARQLLFSIIYYQGVTAMRLAETENCIDCETNSACILPIDPSAVHKVTRGAKAAVEHFTQYLKEFPDDLEVRWLLNLAHMTLGEYPEKVDPKQLLSLAHFTKSRAVMGKFRDIHRAVGLNRLNLAGGAVMDDFDNDGRLDIALTSMDPVQPMTLFRNDGKGMFVEVGEAAGLSKQLGGLNCVQTDYNNDGRLDIFVPRGAWLPTPIRPSLLRNNGNGTFTDVTKEAGLMEAANTGAGLWADYDNDGWLDFFLCCERQPSRLYHNERNGTFRNVAASSGILSTMETFCKGGTWLDYDGDDDPDLFLNYLDGSSHLFRNDGAGKFADATTDAGIDGPEMGFSCWSFDYDNDGRPDILSLSYNRTTTAIVQGILGQPAASHRSKLYHNLGGGRFEDVTAAAGLDGVYATMGSNFGDFDNDGYPDIYLATGEPSLGTLVPNRMFKNEAGRRFTEVTAASGTGHLQKGHGVACGDWDRDGNVDLFVELGGAVPGDRYHNVLFQNPGHARQWITVKLVGKTSNRAALGARIKVTTNGLKPQTIYRWVTSGSSFGGNPLEQTIGLGTGEGISELEIRWPTSRKTQVFRGVPVGKYLEITEGAPAPKVVSPPRIPAPDPLPAHITTSG
jgi:hypothetical protein